MNNETYNGWTNYATWRINLEICSDYIDALINDGDIDEDTEVDEFAEQLENYVDDIVIGDDESLLASYANAFLDAVNYYEIAEVHLSDL